MTSATSIRHIVACLLFVVCLSQTIADAEAQATQAESRKGIVTRTAGELRVAIQPELATKSKGELKTLASKIYQDVTAKRAPVTRIILVSATTGEVLGDFEAKVLGVP